MRIPKVGERVEFVFAGNLLAQGICRDVGPDFIKVCEFKVLHKDLRNLEDLDAVPDPEFELDHSEVL